MQTTRPSDRFIPWYIVAFFVAFVLVLCALAWIAVRGYTGEVTEDAYKKGLAYNTVIEKADAQEALGWKSRLDVAADGQKAHMIFALEDKTGKPVRDAAVSVRCVRPTQAGGDATFVLIADGAGKYTGDITLAWLGVWDVHVSATAQGHNFQQVKTIVLQ